MVTSVSDLGSGLLAPSWPFVTVEEVGHHRFWNIDEDGLPALEFSAPTVAECSNRGLCNQVIWRARGLVCATGDKNSHADNVGCECVCAVYWRVRMP